MAVALNPRNAEAHSNLGVILHAQGKRDQAPKHFKRRWTSMRTTPPPITTSAPSWLNWDASTKPWSITKKPSKSIPDYAEAYYNRGVALSNRGQLDEAMAEYRKAVQIDPRYASAYNNIGNIFVCRKRPEEAIAQYRKALELDPRHVQARFNLANVLVGHGRLDEAIVNYQEGLKIKPDDAVAQKNLAIVQHQRQAILDGLAQRRESLRQNPNNIALLNDTAWVLATNPNESIRNGAVALELALAGG